MNKQQIDEVNRIKETVIKHEFGKYSYYLTKSLHKKTEEKLDSLRKSNVVTNFVSKDITDPQKKEEIYKELSQALDYLSPIKTYLEQQLNKMGTMNQNIIKGMSNFIHGVKKEDVQKQYGEITEIIERIERIKPFYTENPPAVDADAEESFADEYNKYLSDQAERSRNHYMGGRSKSRKNAKRNKRRKTNRRRRA
jgi:hypothetical protein